MQRKGLAHTSRIWSEDGGKTVASVNTGQLSTEASSKTFPTCESTSWTVVRIRGGGRMTILTSRGWRSAEWSPSAAWRAWTRSRGWTSGMTPRLGLATGGLDGGVADIFFTPVFLKSEISNRKSNCWYFCSFRSASIVCWCTIVKASLVLTKLLSGISTQETIKWFLTTVLHSNLPYPMMKSFFLENTWWKAVSEKTHNEKLFPDVLHLS